MTIEEIARVLKPDLRKLTSCGYSVEQVHECLQRYLARRDKYTSLLEELSRSFLGDPEISPSVHSVRYRTKDPSHLVSKLAAKCLKKQKLITADLLFDPHLGVTDLGGIRILHLYKSQWLNIHRYITERLSPHKFHLQEQIAYIRRDHPKTFYDKSANGGFGFDSTQIKPHEFDYASLHYVLQPVDDKDQVFIECQVRTVFEEGWGEIDHAWRYPDGANKIVTNQLQALNNTSSLANDLATTLGDMKHYLPTFIPWEVEQRLERSADEVHCATPRMEWASKYLDQFINQLRESQAHYFYWYLDTKEARKNVNRVKKRLQKEGIQDRVSFGFIPELVHEVFPLFSDVLLLRNALNPTTHDCQDIAVMSAPAPAILRPEDHLDIVIYDPSTVEVIKRFFDKLSQKLGRQWSA